MHKKSMHTLLHRTWLRGCLQGMCLAGLASLLSLPLSAAEAMPHMVLKFVDAETKEPLAGARIVIPPASDESIFRSVMLPEDPLSEPPRIEGPPGQPPPPREYRATTDEKGLASLPPQRTGGPFVVLHEKGVAWLEGTGSRDDDAPIAVKLQPWSRIEGRVLKRGQPSAGEVIRVARQREHVFIGSVITTRSPPMLHGSWTVTDEQGRFVFDRLLPTQVDGEHNVPYVVSLIVRSGDSPVRRGDPVPGYMAGWSSLDLNAEPGEAIVNIGQGTFTLEPGQSPTVELKELPRCVRRVSGRFVMADGSPFMPQQEALPGGTTMAPRFLLKVKVAEMAIGAGGNHVIQNDGRFTLTVPLAGQWSLKLLNYRFSADETEFEFTLPGPVGDSERGEPVDLGDIAVQAERKRKR